MKKTKYCEYSHNCNREEDCFNGEYCPVFKNNPDFSTLKKDSKIDEPFNLEKVFENIWQGKE